MDRSARIGIIVGTVGCALLAAMLALLVGAADRTAPTTPAAEIAQVPPGNTKNGWKATKPAPAAQKAELTAEDGAAQSVRTPVVEHPPPPLEVAKGQPQVPIEGGIGSGATSSPSAAYKTPGLQPPGFSGTSAPPLVAGGGTYQPKGGPVHVRGYYRKDGTYVRPHTRSLPRR